MTEKWVHSKAGIKLLIGISLIFVLSSGYLTYVSRWLTTGLEKSYNMGNQSCVNNQDQTNELSKKIEKMTIRFVTVTLLFLLCLIIITVLFLIKPLNYFNEAALKFKEDDLIDDLDDLDEDDLDEDDEDDDLIDEELLLINRRPENNELPDNDLTKLDVNAPAPGVLARSYNKMFDALQRINELEKQHSIELAEANEQLQTEIFERKKAEREIRYLSNRLISSHEEARKNLAQDLHDEFGQTLTALHLSAETLWNDLPEELNEQKESVGNLTKLIEQLGDKIRSISSDLRPDLLDDLGLIPTLQWYIKEFTDKRQDIQIEFQAIGFRKRLSSENELVLYRIFQEGINNVVKHSKAAQVNVTLTYSYPNVIMVLRDDGVGFEQNRSTDGIGLLGMRERVISVDGVINIVSSKNKGTTIRVELPVEQGSEGSEK